MSTTPISSSTRESDDPIEVAGGFPRHLTQELLEEETRKEERRKWLAPWFLGAAYFLFALAFPLERVIGNFPIKAEAGESLWWVLLEACGGEKFGFIASAFAAGLFLPVTTHALIATGLPRGPSLTAAFCVGVSPLMLQCAALPGPEAAAGLLCLLAFWAAAPHEVGSLRTSVAIAIGIGAALLDPGGLLILPALLLRHFSRSRSAISRTVNASMPGWYGVAWGVALVVALQILWGFLIPEVLVSRDSRVLRYAIFPGVLGLGLALFASLGLFRNYKDSLTEDAPMWLRLWVVGGLASLTFPGACGLCLAPAAAFAIADILSRGIESSRSASALILAIQLILGLGATHHVRTRDPNSAWSQEFRETIQKGDKLLSEEPTHRYLARIRWGYRAYHPSDPLGTLSLPYIKDNGDQPPFLQRFPALEED